MCSSKIAGSVLGVVMKYVKHVTIDLAFIVESKTVEELPENIIGALRFHKLNPETAPELPLFVPHDAQQSAGAATPV